MGIAANTRGTDATGHVLTADTLSKTQVVPRHPLKIPYATVEVFVAFSSRIQFYMRITRRSLWNLIESVFLGYMYVVYLCCCLVLPLIKITGVSLYHICDGFDVSLDRSIDEH